MLGPMRPLAAIWLLPCLCLSLPAQRTLAELQQAFSREAQQLAQKQPQQEQMLQLLGEQIGRLQKFVTTTATGDDRWNGRLMLCDLNLARDDKKGAMAALVAIDKAEAPALLLVTGATLAQRLGMRDLRGEWIDAALAKPAPVPDQLAMARLLTTILVEVDKGEALFQKALAAAGDDEQRAFVRWHRADAMRDREDLPENAGFDELEKLAKDLPGTYWGSVAKDRLRATMLRAGDDGIDFTTRTSDGATFKLAEQRGKAVVLVFWSAADQDMPTLLAQLRDARKEHGAKLVLFGVCLDRDPAAIPASAKALGIDFPFAGEGQGILHDTALRWFVEGPTVHVLDAAGKVVALGQHAGTQDARVELQDAIRRALPR